MTRNVKLTASLIGVIVVAATGGGAAFGANQLALIDLTPAPVEAVVSPEIQGSFSVLRSGAKVASASAAFKESVSEEPLLKSKGGNVGRAVVVSTTYGNAWIVPGKNSVCLYMASPPGEFGYGGTCGSSADAKSGKLATWSMGENGENIRGVALVPDGASVSVTDDSGNKETVAASNNIVSFGGPELRALEIGGWSHKF